MSRNPEKTDEGDPEALWAHSDIEAEVRHDEAERGEALVPHHQLKDESCSRVENLKHQNGDIFKKIRDDVVCKKWTNFLGELEEPLNQRAACVRPHKEIQTDTGADADRCKPSLQTQKPNFKERTKDGGQKHHDENRQQLDTNSEEHMWPLNTGGSPTVHLRTHCVDFMLEQNRGSRKKRLKANETDWETQTSVVAKTRTETTNVNDRCLTRNSVKRAETKVVKNKREAAAEVRIEGKTKHRSLSANMCDSNVKSSHVSSNGYSSSSVSHLTEHLQSPLRMNEPIGCNCSPNLCRKSSRLKRDEEKIQHVGAAGSSCTMYTTQTVTKGERTASPRERRNAANSRDKVKREPRR